MQKLKLEHGDYLVIDPCYIKSIQQSTGQPRFDGLRLIKAFDTGDGVFSVYVKNTLADRIGVDSGRIWVLKAEFDVFVEIDSGCSGSIVVKSKDGKNYNSSAFQIGYKREPRAKFLKDLEDFASNYSDSAIESVGAFDGHGNVVQEIAFKVEGKPYVVTFREAGNKA